MHPNEALVHRFYESFRALDADAMASCYHPEATFDDPVFHGLKGPQIGAMWRMLCANARDFELSYRDVRADDVGGAAHWEPTYRFSKTRRVQNVIDARFAFRDGRIVRHVDTFDLWRWSRMALGPLGTALGWTPLMQRKIRADAAKRLARTMAR